jgi:REP element-mobilizing transposase RayT
VISGLPGQKTFFSSCNEIFTIPIMTPVPLYSAHNLTPAYSLRYSWSGFPTRGERLAPFTWSDPAVNLSGSRGTSSGRYWYHLHMVLVTDGRYRIGTQNTAPSICATCRAVARKHGYRISALSVMPDHLHVLMEGEPSKSPEEIVLGFQNNIAWKLGRNKIWDANYYVGTTGEYTMKAIRKGA